MIERRSRRAVSILELRSSFQGSLDGHLVGEIEVRADRKAHGQPGDPDAERFEHPMKIERRGLPFHRRVGGDDDLLEGPRFDPLDEFSQPELVGPAALERREGAKEDMVSSAVDARLLDRGDVERFLDDT